MIYVPLKFLNDLHGTAKFHLTVTFLEELLEKQEGVLKLIGSHWHRYSQIGQVDRPIETLPDIIIIGALLFFLFFILHSFLN